MRALVLSGGGARGSYQFGVWKALRELKIDFDIVTGTSIGASNGALIVQDDFLLAEEVWNKLNTQDVFYFDYDLHSKEGQAKFCLALAKALIKNGGLELEKMEQILKTYIKEDKVRSSKIKYGLVTYSYTDKKPITLTKEEIPNGKLIDYIIASSTCFPVVKPKQIDDKKYLDGGFYDSMPINLAVNMGADEIIAVDLRTIGLKKQIKNKKAKIKIITPSADIGSFLSFSPNDAKFRIALGYNDTMKAYDKLDGIMYTFKKKDLIKNYQRIKRKYISNFNNILLTPKSKKILSIALYSNIYKNLNNDQKLSKIFSKNIDELGKIYKINVTKVYDIKDFHKLLFKNILNDKISKRNFSDKIIINDLYNLIISKDKRKISLQALTFSKEFVLSLYIFAVYQKYNFIKKYKIKRKLIEKENLWQ